MESSAVLLAVGVAGAAAVGIFTCVKGKDSKKQNENSNNNKKSKNDKKKESKNTTNDTSKQSKKDVSKQINKTEEKKPVPQSQPVEKKVEKKENKDAEKEVQTLLAKLKEAEAKLAAQSANNNNKTTTPSNTSNESKKNNKNNNDKKTQQQAAELAAKLNEAANLAAIKAALEESEDEAEWQVVPAKQKKKKTPKAVTPEDEAKPVVVAPKKITEEFDIPSDKKGLILGKGADTIKKLSTLSGADIKCAKEDKVVNNEKVVRITIESTEAENVSVAKKAIQDLVKKGFCGLLNPDTHDLLLKIPKDKYGQVMGTKGNYIKIIQEKTNTKLIFPEKDSKLDAVRIVGDKENIQIAKQALKSLKEDGFSTLTHDNWMKIEVDFPNSYKANLIGHKGNTIKSIQGDTKCIINFPPDNSDKVIVIGPADRVTLAERQIRRVQEKVEAPVVEVYEDGFGPDDVWGNMDNEW